MKGGRGRVTAVARQVSPRQRSNGDSVKLKRGYDLMAIDVLWERPKIPEQPERIPMLCIRNEGGTRAKARERLLSIRRWLELWAGKAKDECRTPGP